MKMIQNETKSFNGWKFSSPHKNNVERIFYHPHVCKYGGHKFRER